MNKIKFPEPHEVFTEKPSLKKYLKYLLFFGPGAILVSMTIGQGQLIMGPQIGAWAGYTLLWLITLNIGSYIIAYVGCRFTLLSGISTVDIFAIKLRRGWLNLLFMILVLIFIPLFAATIINTLGQTIRWIAGMGHPLFWGISFSLFAVLLVLMGRYKLLEYTQAFFVAVLGIGAIASVIAIKPDILKIIPNFFLIGNVPSYPEWMPPSEMKPIPLVMLGYLGTLSISLIPLVGYLGWIKVKRWGVFKDKENPDEFSKKLFNLFKKAGEIKYLPDESKEIKKSRLLLKPILIDLGTAFILVSLISASYMIAGSAILGKENIPTEKELLTNQVEIFSSLKEGAEWLKPLYQISLFFALFGTIYAGFEAVSRMFYEISKNISEKIGKMDYKKFIVIFTLYIIATGIPLSIWIFMGKSVILVLSITLLFIGVVGVIIYGIGSIYITQKILPEKYRLKKIPLILAITGVILLIIPFLFFIT